MSRKNIIGTTLALLAVVVTAGTLVASNMAFKLNYPLAAAPTSVAGFNTLALPDNRKPNVNKASDVMSEIGFNSVQQIQRFVAATDMYASYTGRAPQTPANDFTLVAGEAYFVKMESDAQYVIAGSDNPGLSYMLYQPGIDAKTGNNFFAWNYHQTGITAKQLMDDIGFAKVQQVSKYVKASNTFMTYTGRAPSPSANNFSLAAGEGYFIKMKTTTAYVPSIY